jgi:uncharacterized RDD family membrane protein YckC
MFTIIGGDGKEYGPATVDQIRTWISAGRASLDTKARALGSEEWRRLGDYVEFADPAAAPPVISTSVAATAEVAGGPELADRGRRFFARLIDWVIEFVCAIPGAMILGPEFLKVIVMAGQGQQPDLEDLDMQRLALGAVVLGVAWLALLIVQVWLLATRGQSIGKRIIGVRIVRYLDNGHAGLVHAWLLREAVFTAIGFVLGLIPFVGPFLFRPAFHLTDWCFIFRDDRRCLHDLMAGTKVVNAAPRRDTPAHPFG